MSRDRALYFGMFDSGSSETEEPENHPQKSGKVGKGTESAPQGCI